MYVVEVVRSGRIGWLRLISITAVVSLGSLFLAPAHAQESSVRRSFGPHVSRSITNDTSAPLRNLMAASRSEQRAEEESEEERARRLPPRRPSKNQDRPKTPLETTPTEPRAPMPSPNVSFDGIANADNPFLVRPPDPVMDVGPNHIVQAVNVSLAIYDKTGAELAAPAPLDSVWSGMAGNNECENEGFGDPIVLYDHLADRWFISQLAIPPSFNEFHACMAVSTTSDPTGPYHRYDFLYSTTHLNDYPKFGVWPDGYYMTVNQFERSGSSFNYAGVGVVAFERDAMLNGEVATFVQFDLGASLDTFFYFSLLPSDLDGPPPAPGTPNFFVGTQDDLFGFDSDAVDVWEFDVNFDAPMSSTFGINSQPNFVIPTIAFDSDTCVFDPFDCIPQPTVPTSAYLDAIAGQPMHRAQYRNFGDRESIVINQTIDANGADKAGIHWAELRDTGSGWTMGQQGLHSPDTDHRWMGSIAANGEGDISVGYSVSSVSTFPSIRYAGRKFADPSGSLPQTENTLMAGGGSQTDADSRWGDYSMMAVDPADDCTFWLTHEYYATTSVVDWKTRIGSFKHPGCEVADLGVSLADSADPVNPGDLVTYTVTATNDGPATATSVEAHVGLPSGAEFMTATVGCSLVGSVVECPIGTLPASDSETFQVAARLHAGGSNVVTATVFGDQSDNFSSNNSDSESTFVSGEDVVLPEGATHSGFKTFVLLANPDPVNTAIVDLTFLTPSGEVIVPSAQNLAVQPRKRRTVDVNLVLGIPADVATVVHSEGALVSAEVSVHKERSLASAELSASPASPTWIVPEGATHSGFTTFLTIANPNLVTDTHVDVDYLPKSGLIIDGPDNFLVPAGGRRTITVNNSLATDGCGCLDDVSTKIVVNGSEPSVVVGMSLHKTSPGDLGIGGSLGVTSTDPTWVVAEGATHSGFSTFVLIANPNPSAATVNVTYLTKNQGTRPRMTPVTIPANSRQTLSVNLELASLGLNPDDVSTLINAVTGTVAVESTVQKQDSSGFVIADSIAAGGSGVADSSGTLWLAPEGATFPGFTTFVLVANANTGASAQVDVKFLTPSGEVAPFAIQNLLIQPGGRITIAVNDYVLSSDASTLVVTDVGKVVVEMTIDHLTASGFSKARSLADRLV